MRGINDIFPHRNFPSAPHPPPTPRTPDTLRAPWKSTARCCLPLPAPVIRAFDAVNVLWIFSILHGSLWPAVAFPGHPRLRRLRRFLDLQHPRHLPRACVDGHALGCLPQTCSLPRILHIPESVALSEVFPISSVFLDTRCLNQPSWRLTDVPPPSAPSAHSSSSACSTVCLRQPGSATVPSTLQGASS